MASFNFTVDTGPMAQTVKTVANQVSHTTQAVVIMQSAVIAAEQESANRICNNLNSGFAVLIGSQIAQRKVKAESIVGAKLLELRQLTVSLRNVQKQLRADYHRISERFLRIFTAVNESLRNNIWICARDAAQLADTTSKELERRENFMGAATPLYVSECMPVAQILTADTLKRTALKTMSDIGRFISGGLELKRAMKSMLDTRETETTAPVYMPVLLVEADELTLEGVQRRIHSTPAQGGIHQKTISRINAAVNDAEADFAWKDCSEETSARIKAACISRVGTQVSDMRVQKIMQDMIKAAAWRNLEAAP